MMNVEKKDEECDLQRQEKLNQHHGEETEKDFEKRQHKWQKDRLLQH